jgi:hypothetical protein
MSDNVVLCKLTSGEEIMYTEISTGTGATIVKDVVTLVYHQNDKGNVSVGFSPFMPYHEGSIAIWHNSIAAVSKPQQQLLSEYTRIHSDIIIAPANSI